MTHFVHRLRNLLSQRRLRAELDRMDAGQLRALAQDVGVSAPELQAITAGNPDAAELLPHRLAALGLDSDALARAMPATARDLERVCSHCASYGRCRRDIERDPEGADWEQYCPNAATLRELQIIKVATG